MGGKSRGGGGPNAKQQKGLEIKAQNKQKKDEATQRQKEEEESRDWAKGSIAKGSARQEEAAAKQDEAARKRREKQELLAAKEAASSNVKAKKGHSQNKKGGKKKNKSDSLSLLEESLVGDADKKAKEAKRKARVKREAEERKRLRRQQRDQEESSSGGKSVDPLMKNTMSMIGEDQEMNHVVVGRSANVASVDGASGIDAALDSVSIKDGADQHPEKRMKALHKAFEERMMPEMKREYPGLRMSQYKEKIFNLWKKSPENPMNQQQQQQK